MKTRQEIFDKVARHLVTQGKRSMLSSKDCAYRGCGGTSCAVGCLIDDEFYDERFEGMSVGVANKFEKREHPNHAKRLHDALVNSGIDVADEDLVVFLRELQLVHDGCDAPEEDFKYFIIDDLKDVAIDYGLNHEILEELKA